VLWTNITMYTLLHLHTQSNSFLCAFEKTTYVQLHCVAKKKTTNPFPLCNEEITYSLCCYMLYCTHVAHISLCTCFVVFVYNNSFRCVLKNNTCNMGCFIALHKTTNFSCISKIITCKTWAFCITVHRRPNSLGCAMKRLHMCCCSALCTGIYKPCTCCFAGHTKTNSAVHWRVWRGDVEAITHRIV